MHRTPVPRALFRPHSHENKAEAQIAKCDAAKLAGTSATDILKEILSLMKILTPMTSLMMTRAPCLACHQSTGLKVCSQHQSGVKPMAPASSQKSTPESLAQPRAQNSMHGAAAGWQAQKQHPSPSLHYKCHIRFVDLDKTPCTKMS